MRRESRLLMVDRKAAYDARDPAGGEQNPARVYGPGTSRQGLQTVSVLRRATKACRRFAPDEETARVRDLEAHRPTTTRGALSPTQTMSASLKKTVAEVTGCPALADAGHLPGDGIGRGLETPTATDS